jgi:tetratricopeptide (TPR) repeat protein
MIKHLWRSLLIVLTAATVVTAADTPEPARAPAADRDLGEARTRIAAKDWTGARDVLQGAVTRDPGNADYHNLLAYSIRHTANPNMDVVFKHYGEALRIDPKHKGAHEYIGEAYLLVGNVPKAKEHLAALDKLCLFSCEEHRDLKKAIQEYEARKKK